MKKIHLLMLCSFFLMSCSDVSKYDDTEIKSKLADHERRLTAIENLLSNYSAITSKVESLSTENNDDFSDAITDLKTKYSSISENLTNLSEKETSDIESINNVIQDLSLRISTIETTIENYSELNAMQEKVSNLETEYAELNTNLNNLKTDYDSKVLEISNSISTLSSTETSDIATLNASITEINENLSTLKTVVDGLNSNANKVVNVNDSYHFLCSYRSDGYINFYMDYACHYYGYFSYFAGNEYTSKYITLNAYRYVNSSTDSYQFKYTNSKYYSGSTLTKTTESEFYSSMSSASSSWVVTYYKNYISNDM